MLKFNSELDNYNLDQVIGAYIKYSNNQKENDSDAISYMIGMLDHWKGLASGGLKRAERLARFIPMIDQKSIYKLILSRYTTDKVLGILNKK